MDQIKNIDISESNIYYYDDEQFVCDGYKGPGWYFWDETEAAVIGPFLNENRATTAFNVYVSALNHD